MPKAEAVSPAPDGGYPGGNTAEGQTALLSLTTGGFNTAVGYLSLRTNTTGSFNTAIGAGTLLANTADKNTATGAGALLSNTTGVQNTADGAFALFSNMANGNTATGYQALFVNTTGNFNVADGFEALFSNSTSSANTAVGYQALLSNTGANNTAAGAFALVSNTTGTLNTAIGASALFNNIDGADNTAVGYQALVNNTAGSFNIAVGDHAGFHLTTGSSNILLGVDAGEGLTTGSNNIYVGNGGSTSGESYTIRIGNVQGETFISGIYDATTGLTGYGVVVDENGQLATASSSRRFKKEIKPMGRTSEAILALRPVTFQYKRDKTGAPQFGLIVEEVAEVNPNLVGFGKDGKPFTVRYDQVNAMLLNEFLKQHRKVEQLKNDFQATIAQQQKEIEALTAMLKEQASQIQKVSAQLATGRVRPAGGLQISKAAPQTVLNDQ